LQTSGLKTTTGQLQNQLSLQTSVLKTSTILVNSPNFEFNLEMLPATGQAVIFRGAPTAEGETPRIIFDPAVYGGGDGRIFVPKFSRIIFSGNLIVEWLDGVHLLLQGTPCGLQKSDRIDWPSIIIQDGATLHLANKATAIIGGDMEEGPAAGKIDIRHHGSISLDRTSHFVIGNNFADDFEILVRFASQISVQNTNKHQEALITFQQACFDISFDHQSALSIFHGGVVEMNMYCGAATDLHGISAEGIIKTLKFNEGSVLQLLQNGLMRLAPNFNPTGMVGGDLPVNFDARSGQVIGDGMLQFKEFMLSGAEKVNAVLDIAATRFQHIGSMVKLFGEAAR